MHGSYEQGDWNSVGLTAVHCVIAANDALLAFFGGIRSISADHGDAIRLLTDTLSTDAARTHANQLRRVMTKKNVVEYENRLFTKQEAEAVRLHAERFLVWAESLLPK